MRFRLLALALVCSAALYGQRGHRRFSWQDYCFNHPAAPFCPGHEYAIKRPAAPTKDVPSGNVGANPFPQQRTETPSVIVVGGIDWRFAEPSADSGLAVNGSRLPASPLTR